MTARAVSLTVVSLRSEGPGRSRVATRIMTSAVLDDIASLATLAVVIPLVTDPNASVDVPQIALVAGKAIAFFLLITLIGVVLFPPGRCPERGLLPRHEAHRRQRRLRVVRPGVRS